MPSEASSTANIERLHELTRHGDTALAAFDSKEMRHWLAQFILRELPDLTLPPVDSAQAFVKTLRELRKSQQLWSQAYGELALDFADDPAAFERERLYDFISECPWRFLRESALQATQELGNQPD